MNAIISCPVPVRDIYQYRPVRRGKDPLQWLWSELRFAREPLDLFQLHQATDLELKVLIRTMDAWVAAGHVISTKRSAEYFTMTDAAKDMAKRPKDQPVKHLARRSGLQRIWSAISVLKTFSMPELLMASSTNRTQAVRYLLSLVRAGYLEQLGNSSSGHRRYRLIKFTGPRHPRPARLRTSKGSLLRVTDGNTGEVIEIILQTGTNFFEGGN